MSGGIESPIRLAANADFTEANTIGTLSRVAANQSAKENITSRRQDVKTGLVPAMTTSGEGL